MGQQIRTRLKAQDHFDIESQAGATIRRKSMKKTDNDRGPKEPEIWMSNRLLAALPKEGPTTGSTS